MNAPVFHLVYVSSAAGPMDRPALESLLATSRTKNGRLGVTGMLLYHDGNFMQALEGREPTVLSLIDDIGRDPRHKDMRIGARYTSDEREFAGWDMAFHQLSADSEASRAFIDLTRDRTRLERELGTGGIARLWLDSFRRNLR